MLTNRSGHSGSPDRAVQRGDGGTVQEDWSPFQPQCLQVPARSRPDFQPQTNLTTLEPCANTAIVNSQLTPPSSSPAAHGFGTPPGPPGQSGDRAMPGPGPRGAVSLHRRPLEAAPSREAEPRRIAAQFSALHRLVPGRRFLSDRDDAGMPCRARDDALRHVTPAPRILSPPALSPHRTNRHIRQRADECVGRMHGRRLVSSRLPTEPDGTQKPRDMTQTYTKHISTLAAARTHGMAWSAYCLPPSLPLLRSSRQLEPVLIAYAVRRAAEDDVSSRCQIWPIQSAPHVVAHPNNDDRRRGLGFSTPLSLALACSRLRATPVIDIQEAGKRPRQEMERREMDLGRSHLPSSGDERDMPQSGKAKGGKTHGTSLRDVEDDGYPKPHGADDEHLMRPE
ncbi:hypothetical protein CDD80_4929 [Ophiocordyceps camponoti-rufipedis]|uniref:Uncharacterized protein n=1 Tax=Ophiocordyceps camponoti-rufipedis TaxID=2004952 RepID=A0A2C5YSX7_9HYPO|nr:hypothetical protein CDD80_4929 [Ophiocordyceps camponoti-rufipedis]